MNLACGGQLTLNQLLDLLKKITGSDAEAIYTDPRPGDVRRSWADITLSEKILNYRTKVPLEEGLRKAVDYFNTVLKS
jgi:nucleoside-diphosphate-sugar epimerase